MKKLTLEEEFFAFHTEINESGLCIVKGSPMDIWNYFKPHLKLKQSKPKIEIPEDKAIEFNELFPKGKALKTGKYMKCNVKEVIKSFERFFKDYNYSWETIFSATANYLLQESVKNYEWTLRSKYFVTKLKDGVLVSELAEWCDRVENGESFAAEPHSFEPKVY